ncbi:thermonuclease family protein [Congregibacter variabilis]|uniref:Thermonuclease family protein n=1 Tax=Congregibacter variabilis TaxID=3081200 RepID=A0ABZ0I2G4_9GAMM|nr:thermonuclease family protein [Congregibacter sp. IMCC43200]
MKAASLLNRADIQYTSDSSNTASKPDTSQPIPPAGFGPTGEIVRVVDGDIVELQTNETVCIRLHGIDTPEKGQPFGKAATREVSRLIAGTTIGVEAQGTDLYGRTIGVIYLDGKNINVMMVESGCAWWYRQYARDDLNPMQAETNAKEAKRGLWADPDQIAPSECWGRSDQ